MPQLYIEKDRLQIVEQACKAMSVILAARPVLTVESHSRRKERDFRVVGRDCAAVAIPSKDLEGIEAPTSGGTPRSRPLAVDRGSETLTCVFNHMKLVI